LKHQCCFNIYYDCKNIKISIIHFVRQISISVFQIQSHYYHTNQLHWLERMWQRKKRTFNNLRSVSYFSRCVIIIIYFSWNVISLFFCIFNYILSSHMYMQRVVTWEPTFSLSNAGTKLNMSTRVFYVIVFEIQKC
jgi:hypothetical protein